MHDFGRLEQHDVAFQMITLTNIGQRMLAITSIELSEGLSVITDTIPAALMPGEVIDLNVSIDTSRANAAFASTLLIRSESLEYREFLIDFSGTIRAYIRDVASSNPGFRDALESIRTDAGLVGLVAAVVRGRDIIALEGVGFADREAEIVVDPRQTRFRWASVAKSMGAVAALRRAEDVDLDVSIETYFHNYEVPSLYLDGQCRSIACARELPTVDRRITLRQLFAHRAGIQHYSDGIGNPSPHASQVNDPAVNTGMEWALANFTSNPLVGPPDSTYNYSSFGYNLAGVVLEKALGASYEQIVLHEVAAPLGMQTLSADRFWVDIPDRAVGYRFTSSTATAPVRDNDTDVSWKLAGGGFISTIVELARYCGGLQNEVLLSADVKRNELWSDPYDQNYGLGLGVGRSRGHQLISHTGSQQKAASSLRLYPERDECIVIMSNTRPQSSRSGFDSAGDIGRLVDFAWQDLND